MWTVIHQNYDVYVEMEHVIKGNDAIFKCKIPSHVSDLIAVTAWVDSTGSNFNPEQSSSGNALALRIPAIVNSI